MFFNLEIPHEDICFWHLFNVSEDLATLGLAIPYSHNWLSCLEGYVLPNSRVPGAALNRNDANPACALSCSRRCESATLALEPGRALRAMVLSTSLFCVSVSNLVQHAPKKREMYLMREKSCHFSHKKGTQTCFNPESPRWLEKRPKRSPRDLHKLKYTHTGCQSIQTVSF